MAELKDRRFITEAMEILDTMDDVVQFDPTEKFIEILESGSDDEQLARAFANALVQKGCNPERFQNIIQTITSEFENSSTSFGEEQPDFAEDVFVDVNKFQQKKPLTPEGQANRTAAIRSMVNSKARDEMGDGMKNGNNLRRRVKYEEM